MTGFLFDTSVYVQSLSWLGEPQGSSCPSWLLRQLPWGDTDARGSWPYQSFPSESVIEELLCDRSQVSPLTWTGVIRPDIPSQRLQGHIQSLREHLPVSCLPLKSHLCHTPDAPPAHTQFSRRTCKRLREAEKIFQVCSPTDLEDTLSTMAKWQAHLQVVRGIPRCSSPNLAHFLALGRLVKRVPDSIRVLELRRRDDNQLQAAMLLVRALDPQPCWHAHSFLSLSEARRYYGTYLLFVAAIEQLGQDPLWWGGQPSGASGAGVFNFKKRFANGEAPAHLLYIELRPERVAELLPTRSHYNWFPPYRNPTDELSAH